MLPRSGWIHIGGSLTPLTPTLFAVARILDVDVGRLFCDVFSTFECRGMRVGGDGGGVRACECESFIAKWSCRTWRGRAQRIVLFCARV